MDLRDKKHELAQEQSQKPSDTRVNVHRAYTRERSEDTRAATPEVIMIARARLEPVPPLAGPIMMGGSRGFGEPRR